MNPDEINKKYWSTVAPGNIMSGLCYPGEELTSILEPKSTVLDVGCGNAKISTYLSNKGYTVTGIDINQNAIDANTQSYPDINFMQVDITQALPFGDKTFDAIVIPYVFVSIIDKEKQEFAAQELIRILKPGGYLWICEATLSKDYEDRYIKGKNETGLDHVALSYSKESEPKVQRVIRHYTEDEMNNLFTGMTKVSTKQINVVSPSSGMTVETIVSVYQRI